MSALGGHEAAMSRRADLYCIVCSDPSKSQPYGWALSTTGSYIMDEHKDQPLAEFTGRDDAVAGCQDHIRFTRETQQGEAGKGVMHTVMRSDEWRTWASDQTDRRHEA